METRREHYVWVEKYRPQTLADCIFPTAVQTTLEGIITQQNMTNLLLSGRAGTGKTTAAKVLVRALDADFLLINGSDERNIDTLRNIIKDYATTMAIDERRKYVILDEADYLNPQSTQPALRSFMEEYSQYCGFILTANYPTKIIPPLKSRCSLVDFKIPSAEKSRIARETFDRCCEILTAEHVTYEKKVVAEVVKNFFPDFRRILNELQRFSVSGVLSESILSQLSDKDVSELFAALKSQDYAAIRKWVGLHEDMDAPSFYSMLMDYLPDRVTPESLPELIVQLGDYNYRAAFASDHRLNTLACLTEIYHSARFK